MLSSFFRKFISREENEDNSAILQLTSMPESQEMIKKYTKLVVAELDPDELVIFEKELEIFFNDPIPSKAVFQKDNPLGAGDIFGEMIPYTQSVAYVIVFLLTSKLLKPTTKALVKRMKEFFDPNSLTKEQAREYKKLINKALEEFNIPEGKKKKISEVIIAKFFMQE